MDHEDLALVISRGRGRKETNWEPVRTTWGALCSRFHNPTKTCLSIGTDEFTDIAIVDKVLKQGGTNAHARK